MNREQFEKLEEIAKILKDEDTHWCDKRSVYVNQRVFQDSTTGYLNGAWYSHQEQQKKIDQIMDVLRSSLRIEKSLYCQVDALKSQVAILEGLLK